MSKVEDEVGRTVRYEHVPGSPLTEVQKRNLEELRNNPDREIDLSDIPEMTEEQWKNAIPFALYRARKEAISLRIDADVLAWLKKSGPGYQTRVNQVLREKMLEELDTPSSQHYRNTNPGS